MKQLITDNLNCTCKIYISFLSVLPDNSFDLAICDPPYGAATAKWNYDNDPKNKRFWWKLEIEQRRMGFAYRKRYFQKHTSMAYATEKVSKANRFNLDSRNLSQFGFLLMCFVSCWVWKLINEVIWYKRNASEFVSKAIDSKATKTFCGCIQAVKTMQYNFNYDDVKRAKFEGLIWKEAEEPELFGLS